MTAIIKRSLELANWPPLEVSKQLPRRVAIWTEFLYPRVPQGRLPESFNKACDDHDSQYPVNAFEINQAWRGIRQAEESEAQLKAKAEAHLQPKRCSLEHTSEEEMLVAIFDQTSGEDVLMPCPNCRPKAFEQKQREILEKRRAATATA